MQFSGINVHHIHYNFNYLYYFSLLFSTIFITTWLTQRATRCQFAFFIIFVFTGGYYNIQFFFLCVFYVYIFEVARCLTTEAVEGLALPLEGVDNIHGGDGLPASVLGVGDGVTDDVLKENLEDTAGLLVDQARDALDSTPARQAADGGLGDALDVVPKDLAVTLGASLSQSLSSFSSS